MEDAQRFDPVKGLSQRVLSRLAGAPELDLNEDELPQPGEQVRVWYAPESYDALERRSFHLENEVVEVVQWYRPATDSGIVALIYRETRRGQSINVLYGDDWTVDEAHAIDIALAFLQGAADKILLQLKALTGRREELERRREQVEIEKAALAAERAKALVVLLVHRSEPNAAEAYTVDQARKRGLELMADQQVRITVADDSVADDSTIDAVPDKAGALLLIEHILGEGDAAYPAISAAQAKLIDVFHEQDKLVWVWRDSQGKAVAGHEQRKAFDPEENGEPVIVVKLEE